MNPIKNILSVLFLLFYSQNSYAQEDYSRFYTIQPGEESVFVPIKNQKLETSFYNTLFKLPVASSLLNSTLESLQQSGMKPQKNCKNEDREETEQIDLFHKRNTREFKLRLNFVVEDECSEMPLYQVEVHFFAIIYPSGNLGTIELFSINIIKKLRIIPVPGMSGGTQD